MTAPKDIRAEAVIERRNREDLFARAPVSVRIRRVCLTPRDLAEAAAEAAAALPEPTERTIRKIAGIVSAARAEAAAAKGESAA